METIKENANIVESTKNAVALQSSDAGTLSNITSDLSQSVPVPEVEVESMASNTNETEGNISNSQSKSENRPSTPPENGVKSKEAARKNILQYVGKLQAKEQKQAKELISRGGESSL